MRLYRRLVARIREDFAGAPLKSIALSTRTARVRGEAVVTAEGIEGGAVYALSAALRDAIAADGVATLAIDFKPDIGEAALAARLMRKPGQSISTCLRKARRACCRSRSRSCAKPGHCPTAPRRWPAGSSVASCGSSRPAPIARAISTAGGVAWSELDEDFMLSKRPGVFVAGEMIDWEAPTGGYLLQACFATGAAAGQRRGALGVVRRAGCASRGDARSIVPSGRHAQAPVR